MHIYSNVNKVIYIAYVHILKRVENDPHYSAIDGIESIKTLRVASYYYNSNEAGSISHNALLLEPYLK